MHSGEEAGTFFDSLVVCFVCFLSVCRFMSIKCISTYCTFALIPIYSVLTLDL